jgi:CRISPR-associated protein Cas8a1/Csx13
VVVPDVVDPRSFAIALSRLTARRSDVSSFSSSLRGRVVGGAEEAAMRFLLDLTIQRNVSHKSVSRCLAIAMGKVAWDKNQVNRSSSIEIRDDYPEMAVFEAANQYLGRTRLVKGRNDEAFAVPTSHIPELVAANLASDRHWCSDFKSLVAEKKDFQRMFFSLKGLIKMKHALQDADDLALIQVFHEAWKRKMKAMYVRAERDGLDGDHLVEVERERMRNDILRTKTMDSLGGWFLRFCADATRGATLPGLRDQSSRVRQFIFNARNFDRIQNLCLFALVSYEGKDAGNSKREE